MLVFCLAVTAFISPVLSAHERVNEPVATTPAGPAKLVSAPPTIEVEATSAWVRDHVLPEATKARTDQAQSGVTYLLTDEQYRTRADGHDDWFRSAFKVTNRSGLESAGQIALNYDPELRAHGG